MAYIQYAKGGTDYRTKGTISCWVKRSKLTGDQYIWSWGENNSSDAYLRFDSANNIECNIDGAGSNFNSTRLFRDPNAWYHFVVSLDGSNATANLRRRIWVNGVQLDDGNSAIGTFSAAIFGAHSTHDLWFGSNARSQQGSSISALDGLMSHIHYCSNYSYAASDFGETDATTGEWKIKTSPNVQYGSEGFFLKMEDSSNLDLDSSGNNKTLTTSGTLTATKDCPSNIFATLNPLDNATSGTQNFSNGNTTFETNKQCRTTLGASSGKWYCEAKYVNNTSYSGIAQMDGDNSYGTNSIVLFGANNGEIFVSNSVTDNNVGAGTAIDNNSIIMFAMDLDNNRLYIGKNGSWWTDGAGFNSANLNSYKTITRVAGDSFGFKCSSGSGTGTTSWNFGNGVFGTTAVSSAGTNASNNGIFEYNVPTGYTALSTKGLNS